jgi:DNA-binding transcriptional regulator LsrR (DeoR family)
VRPVRLIAEGCGLSRAEVERLIAEGRVVSAVRLSGKLSSGFTFTLKR